MDNRTLDSLVRDLRRLGTDQYWSRRARRQGWRARISNIRSWPSDRFDEHRRTAGTLGRVVAGAIGVAVPPILVMLACEAVAAAIHGHHFAATIQLFKSVSNSSEYEAFVGAGVGAEAVLLALFFTTVGVIASTAYAQVPGEIRRLFVRERSSRIYAYSAVWSLVFGVALLAANALSYKPRVLTIVAFGALMLFTVLTLVRLGSGLFNFFDLSSLSTGLPTQFQRAVDEATVRHRRQPANGSRQLTLHSRAAGILERYRQLSVLLVNRQGGEIRAPLRLLNQLLQMWAMYAARRPAIPSKSKWFALTAEHPNWLTVSHHRLNIALQTRTGLQPSMNPDPLWVERRLQLRISELLGVVFGTDDATGAIGVLDTANGLAGLLASQFFVEEALMLLDATRTEKILSKEDEAPTATLGIDDPRGFLRMAAVERSTLGLTAVWLGLARGAEAIDVEHLKQSFDIAVGTETGPYGAQAPRPLLLVLEQMAQGIAFERRTEGRRVTPAWWTHHYAAKSIAQIVVESVGRMFSEAERLVVARAEGDELKNDVEARATLTFSGTELAHKMKDRLPVIRDALGRLKSLQSPAVGDDTWTEGDVDVVVPTSLERRLMITLADIVLDLPLAPHSGTRPDLFGHAYKLLFDATFNALLTGDNKLSGRLFGVVMAAADKARERLVSDLADEAPTPQFIFGTEPIVDLMEISGYALFMQELNGDGIWPFVHDLWDNILSGTQAPALAQQLAEILETRGRIFALTQGGIERTGRRTALTRVLEDRKVVGDRTSWSPLPDQQLPADQSPIVTVFAPEMHGHFGNLEDLFVAEYLIARTEAQGLTLPSGAAMLRDRIERVRQEQATAATPDNYNGEDEDNA